MEVPLSEAPGGPPEDVSRVPLPTRTSWSRWKTWHPGGQRCHWDAWTCGSKGPTRREGGPRRCRRVHHRPPRPPRSAGHSRFPWISGSHWARWQTGPPRTQRGDGPDRSPRTAGTSRTKRRKGSVWRVPTSGAPEQHSLGSALQPDHYPEGGTGPGRHPRPTRATRPPWTERTPGAPRTARAHGAIRLTRASWTKGRPRSPGLPRPEGRTGHARDARQTWSKGSSRNCCGWDEG